jgi:hypothetical protein
LGNAGEQAALQLRFWGQDVFNAPGRMQGFHGNKLVRQGGKVNAGFRVRTEAAKDFFTTQLNLFCGLL